MARVFAPDKIPDSGWSAPFEPPLIWLGTEKRGLAIFCESDEGWDQGGEAKRVTRDANTVNAALGMIRSPRKLDTPFTFSFGLLANPWRPPEKGCERFRNYHYHSLYALTQKDLRELHAKGYRTLIFHELWADKHAYPETVHAKELSALVQRCHRAGLKLLVYLGAEFSREAPEWPVWGMHWANKDVPGYRRAPHVCFNSEWPDFIVHGVECLMKKFDLDGVYLDAWALWLDKPCANQLHGCGYTLPDGMLKQTFPFWKCRELMERVYVTVKSIKPGGRLSLHANPGLCMAQFGTDCFAGEGVHGNFRNLNMQFIRALHMGLEQWGTFSELIASADYDYGEAVGLLHNVLPRAGAYELSHKNIVDQPAAIWRIQDAFGKTQAQWLPYWRNAELVSADAEQIKVSLWNRPGKGALLVISNLGISECQARIRLRRQKLAMPADTAALEMLPCKPSMTLNGDGVALTLPAGKCQLVFLAPRDSSLWPRMRKARQWVARMHARRIAEIKYESWLLAGPFGEADPAPYIPAGARRPETPPEFCGMETVYPPESPFKPDAVFETAGGKRGAWTVAMAENGDLTFPKIMLREKWDIAYAYTRICFPTLVPSLCDNPVNLLFLSHHAFKIWVNGREVYTYGGAGTPRYGQKILRLNKHTIKVVLHPGWNELLVKLVARDGANFQYAITGPEGHKLPPLLISARD